MKAKRVALILCAAVLCVRRITDAGTTLSTLASFNYSNGGFPYGNLSIDAAGNIYGTTSHGGTNGYGTVFELTGPTHQTLTTLVNFNSTTGQYSFSGLTTDSAGNLYGTTYGGGTNGSGTVFELSGNNHQSLTTLASFNNTNGANPYGSLTVDAAGNLYGTASAGGANGDGTVFEVSGTNHQTLTALVTFNGANGRAPYAGLTADTAGNLYGVTQYGGTSDLGTVFQLSGNNHQTLTTLATFDGTHGIDPVGGLMFDTAGNLYGSTLTGGANGGGNGSVFELSGMNHQTLKTLVTFQGPDGADPNVTLISDAAGNLYGTTLFGGVNNNNDGTIFELSGSNHQTLTTLVTFNGTNGYQPYTPLLADANGNLFGTTNAGGVGNDGTVFELTGTGFVVPEPSAFSPLAAGSLPLLFRRFRKRPRVVGLPANR